jgi:hypothetical protein
MKYVLTMTLLLAPITAHAAGEISPAAQQLKSEHANALAALRQWTQFNPQAAAYLRLHQGHTRMLIDWTADHSNATVEDFKAVDPQLVAELARTSPLSLDHFMAWIHNNPEAAKKAADGQQWFWDVVAEAMK